MILRIGQIPYLNSVLFYHGLDGFVREAAAGEGVDVSFELSPLVPRQLSGAAAEGAVDAGPVPLVTCWDLEDTFEPLGDFCIATTHDARSILLYSKRPAGELDGAHVGVTSETSTSVRLLDVLLTHRFQVHPGEWGRVDWPRNEAFLLIGDEALLHRRGVDGYPHRLDLGRVWRDWTGLPFVFARWVVRKDCDATARAVLERALASAVEVNAAQMDEAGAAHGRDIGMEESDVREYLHGFHFRMTPAEHDAVARFRELDAAVRGARGVPRATTRP